MKYPRKLIDRDPRNREHVATALKMLMELGNVTITARTEREIKKTVGADAAMVLRDCTVTPTVPEQDIIMVAAMFYFEEGLMFPDNILIACTGCKTPLQIRPESLLAKEHWCAFCAADQALMDYWTRRKK